jgi:hypothetical protein
MAVKIPPREGQGVNGLGVSVLSVIALILFLPIASSAVVTVATYFGGEPTVVGLNDGGYTQYPIQDSAYDNMAAFRWIDSGSTQYSFCEPALYPTAPPTPTDEIQYSPYAYGVGYDYQGSGPFSCDTDNTGAEVLGEFNDAYWVEHGGCVKDHSPIMECGGNSFVFSIMDKGQDYSEFIPTAFAFRMWSASVNQVQAYAGNEIRFDYEVSIEVWQYLEFVNGQPYQKYVNTEVLASEWDGTFVYENCFHVAADCDKATFSLVHELNSNDLMRWKTNITERIDPVSPYPLMVGFRIHVSNIFDDTQNLPIMRSLSPMPWDAENEEPDSLNPVYSTFYLSTQSIEAVGSATRVVVGGLGGLFMVGALASTPYWNPIVDRVNRGRRGY